MELVTAFLEPGGSLVVSFTEPAAGVDPEQTELRLYRSGDPNELIAKITGTAGASSNTIEFKHVSVPPGMYDMEVTAPPEKNLFSPLFVAESGHEDYLRSFQKTVEKRGLAQKSNEPQRTRLFKEVQTEYEALGLHHLAKEVAREVAPPRPFDLAVRTKTAIIRIKLIRSPICTPFKHKAIVSALGLKKMNRVVERPDTPAFRGMVKKIPHLLAIVE